VSVVDINILVHLYIRSARSSLAAALLRHDPDWTAPLLWRSEFRNVLALYLRQERLNMFEARQSMDDVTEMMLDWEYEVNSHPILDLVAHSTCTAYDCEFVALARELCVPLVTAERQILQQFPDVAVSLDAFLPSHNA
jgi:predicted nucleic acid-binding protein